MQLSDRSDELLGPDGSGAGVVTGVGPGAWKSTTPWESWTVRYPVAEVPLPLEVTLSAQGGTPPTEEVPLWKTAYAALKPPALYTTKLQSCAHNALIRTSMCDSLYLLPGNLAPH